MANPRRPILPLPPGQRATYTVQSRPRGGNEHQPKKRQVVSRLRPRFQELERVLDARRAELADHASGASPEQILVFEMTSAGVKPFIEALGQTNLAWLTAYDRDDAEPDTNFYNEANPERLLTTRLFMVMANVEAMDQLLTLWKRWKSNHSQLGKKHAASWGKAFKCLRDIRYWGPEDRVADTGLLEDWRMRAQSPYKDMVPLEVELWFRDSNTRDAAEARVRADVAAAGGEVFDATVIPEIAYHAVLAELPVKAVNDLLHNQSIALARSHDIHLLRPVPQQPPYMETDARPDHADAPNFDRRPARGTPTVALFDGLPLQRHALLDGRLVVHDPDDWETDYPNALRRHGTAMASLILHGDLGSANDPAPRPLYVHPILKPDGFGVGREEAPAKRLWVDVIHRAVLHMVGTGGAPASAPDVRIVNLSIGDEYRPFLRQISPLARLLDWLAWERQILFVVSAGNHGELRVEAGDEPIESRVLQAMQAMQRHRRLLSPAESINALTVGAQPIDAAGEWTARHPDEVELITTTALPSPFSALGRGFRSSVKPELLAPGGRAIFARSVEDPCQHTVSLDRARLGPGQRTAAPGRQGDLDSHEYSVGTSNAAALVSRAALRVLEVVRELFGSTDYLAPAPEALLVKTLLVHTSTWDRAAYDVLEEALRTPENAKLFKDYSTAYLGYGSLRTDRALECEIHRATLIGGGELGLETAIEHRVPLPPSLNAYTGIRRVIVTLAWFSPVVPSHRNYRVAALETVVTGIAGLNVKPDGPHMTATKRGTLQHLVYQGARSAVRAGILDDIVITIRARPDAPARVPPLIPYALAVTVEATAETPVPIYEEIAARVRPRVQIGSRSS